MITAVRLRERDKRKGFGMRTYFSANSRTKYTAGENGHPSAFRVVRSSAELNELRRFPQFEILEFDDLDHLQAFVQQEMEERARVGLPAVRAAIMSGAGSGKVAPKKVAPRKSAHDRLPPAASGPASDPSATNTGRRPAPEASKEATERKAVTPKPKPQPKPQPKKTTPAPKGPAKAKGGGKQKTKKQLLALAKKRGLEVNAKMKKADIEKVLEQAASR